MDALRLCNHQHLHYMIEIYPAYNKPDKDPDPSEGKQYVGPVKLAVPPLCEHAVDHVYCMRFNESVLVQNYWL